MGWSSLALCWPQRRAIRFGMLGPGFLSVAWPANWCFSLAPGFSGLFGVRGSPSSGGLPCLLGPRFWFVGVGVMICLLVGFVSLIVPMRCFCCGSIFYVLE